MAIGPVEEQIDDPSKRVHQADFWHTVLRGLGLRDWKQACELLYGAVRDDGGEELGHA